MKKELKSLAVLLCFFATVFRIHSQGYVVPNGVTYVGFQPGAGYQINVLHDPTNLLYTGFALNPVSGNTFQFNPIVDVGVRVFLTSSNAAITQASILGGAYAELTYPNGYVFANGVPFYLALYTGNVTSAPSNGIYSDPLFGWAELENVGGAIELLNSAVEYNGGGIYVGTTSIIPTPEPSVLSLVALGGAAIAWGRSRKSS